MSNQKLSQLTPQDLRNIILLAHNIGYLKSKREQEQEINLSDSWLTKYGQI